VKALKTILEIDLNSYMLKKLLSEPIEFNTEHLNYFLYDVMCQPKIREKFKFVIDYKKWNRDTRKCFIPLKKPRDRNK
jgi:hypothetical protein